MLLILTACNHSTQTIDLQKEKEVRTALTSTWESEYMEIRSTRTKVPENQISQIMLNENGTYSSGVKDGEIKQKGSWNYDVTTNMLGMDNEPKKQSRILKLTNKELILSQYFYLNDEIMDSTISTFKKI